MIYDFKSIDFKNIPGCMDKVIALLAEAKTLMAVLVNTPLAEPDAPCWDDFWKRPNIHELVDTFFAIYDAEKFAKKTLGWIEDENENELTETEGLTDNVDDNFRLAMRFFGEIYEQLDNNSVPGRR